VPHSAARAWDLSQSDVELIAAARSGSALAFEVLVDRYYLVIQQYLVRQTGDPELAADLAQETFLDAYRLVHRIPEDRPLIAWLYLIARNNLRPVQRRQRRFQFLSIDRLLRTITASFPALHQRDIALDAGEQDLIQQTLNRLAPTLREALLLRSVAGFTGHEVSQILNVSPAAARKRISRAEQQFRDLYAKLAERQGDDTL
jgi:RNA polymerase sigma-70 factor (ECF subfamily)